MNAVALDLATPARPAEVRSAAKLSVRVVRGGRYSLRRVRRTARYLAWIAGAALLLVMVVGVIYGQAQITELSGGIDSANQELINLQSTYDYLAGRMSDITSSSNVQQIAEGRLGLVRADTSQITYVKLHQDSVVERASTSATLAWDSFRTAALSLLGHLDP